MKWMMPMCLVAALAACDSDESASAADAHQAVEDPAQEACLHAAEGPFADITATPDANGAPDAFVEHTAVRLTIPPAASGGYHGVVSIPISEAGEYAVFLSADVPLAVGSTETGPIDLESSEPSDACPEIAKRILVDLPVGTAFFTFAASPVDQVVMVIEAVEGHEGH